MKLCIDIDGVIANSLDLFLEIIPEVTRGRVNYKLDDINHWRLEENQDALGNSITPEEFEKAHEIFSARAMEIKPMEGASAAILDLTDDFDIHYVTGRQHTTKETTQHWLTKHHFPGTLTYAERGHKQNYCLDAEFVIEDDPYQAQICEDWGIAVLLFAQPYNINSTQPRLESWSDILEKVSL
jgi:5'(3')-deoxyribonucleotidase